MDYLDDDSVMSLIATCLKNDIDDGKKIVSVIGEWTLATVFLSLRPSDHEKFITLLNDSELKGLRDNIINSDSPDCLLKKHTEYSHNVAIKLILKRISLSTKKDS